MLYILIELKIQVFVQFIERKMENEDNDGKTQRPTKSPLQIQEQSRSVEPIQAIELSTPNSLAKHQSQIQFNTKTRFVESDVKHNKASEPQSTLNKSTEYQGNTARHLLRDESFKLSISHPVDTTRNIESNSKKTEAISPVQFKNKYKPHVTQENLLDPTDITTRNQDNSRADVNVSAQSKTSEMEQRLTKKFNAVYTINEKNHLFSLKSLYCLGRKNRLRTACVHTMVNKWFERFITSCIVINSLLLATREYDAKYDFSYESTWNGVLDKIDLFFTVVFIFECLVKVIGMGFILHKKSYMRDKWNWIDFFIVLVSIVAFTPGIDPKSLKVFRTARILRPLRSMSQLKSMRMVIQTFINSIPGLFNVCIFQAFIFTIFAIISINFFVGQQYQFCRSEPNLIDDGNSPAYWPKSEDAGWQCRSDTMCTGFPNNLGEDSGAICGDIYRDYGLDPVEFDQVRENELINYDITNFNSVLNAYLTIFQVITLEGWTQVMYNYQDTVSYATSSIYFVLIVVLGAFTTLNLILAAIMHSYLKEDEKLKKQEAKDQLKLLNQQSQSLRAEVNKATITTAKKQADQEANNDLLSVIDELDQANGSSIQINTFGNAPPGQLIDMEQRLRNAAISSDVAASESRINSQESVVIKAPRSDHNQSQQLPSLYGHGQSLTKINGIQAHQELEKQIIIDQSVISSQRSLSEVRKENLQISGERFGAQDVVDERHMEQAQSQSCHLSSSFHYKLQDAAPVDNIPASDPEFAMQSLPNNFFDVDLIIERQQEQSQFDQDNDENNPKSGAEINPDGRARSNCFLNFFYDLVISVKFNFLIYLFILGNTITLALYRFDQSDSQTDVLAVCDIVFVWVFTVEMLAKMIGLGLRNYARDKFNIFDAIIVVIGLVDFVMTLTIEIDESTDGIMSALRALRLLRVVKLARHWKALQEILTTMVKSLADISNFTLLLLITLYMFALLGMEIFSFSVVFDMHGNPVFGEDNIKAAFESGQEMVWPRDNYNNIFSSLVTCFIVIFAEDWNQTMYLYVRAKDVDGSSGRSIALTYFVSLFSIGNAIMLALFTALLLRAQDDDLLKLENRIDQHAKKRIMRSLSSDQQKSVGPFSAISKMCSRNNCRKKYSRFADSFVKIFGGETAYNQRIEARMNQQTSKNSMRKNSIVPSDGNENESPQKSVQDDKQKKRIVRSTTSKKKIDNFIQKDTASIDEKDRRPLQRPASLLHYDYDQVNVVRIRASQTKVVKKLRGRSLYIFNIDNPLRKCTNSLTSFWVFDAVIILLILISTVTLAFEHPLEDPNSEKMQILEKIDIGMTAVFSLEALLKIITSGFLLNGKKSYLRNSWNILDFTIVIMSIVSLSIDANISFVKVLRVARILRPLRLIKHAESLKIAIKALFKSIPQIMRLQVVVLFVIFMISILLTSLLSGKLYRCNLEHTGLSYAQQEHLVQNKWDCLSYGGYWTSPEMNFDNTLRGMLTLFIFQTREGWVGLMWDSVDAKGVNEVPVRGNQIFFIILYLFLVVILCLLFVNMFVRIVIQTYNLEKDFLSFNRLLNDGQRSWIQVQIMTYGFQPLPLLTGDGYKCLRRVCIKVSQSIWFENFIMACIMLNTIVMALLWFDEPDELHMVQEILNYVFAGIFTLEAVIKLIAQQSLYFRDSWNIFDFTIVVFTLALLLLKIASVNVQFGSGATILRALRIGRIVRLIKQAQKLQIIFHTLVDSSQSLASLGLLLIILFFMFAIIGRSLFGKAKVGEPNLEVNEHANFQDFVTSILLLMRCSTGESWHLIMFDMARTYDATYQCRENEDYEQIMANGGEPFECGSPIASYIFFIFFNILVTQVFINLFIAIIIDAFLEQTDHFQLPIKKYEIQDFVATWQEFDPQATGFILIKDLNRFMLALCKQPWGCLLVENHQTISESFLERKAFVAKLGIPTYDQLKKVMFYDTLQQLCYMKNLRVFNESPEMKLKMKVLQQWGQKVEDDISFNSEKQKDIQLDFEKILRKMGRLNPKIKLILKLQDYFKAVHDKYARFADNENNIGYSDKQRREMKATDLDKINQKNKQTVDDLNLLSTKHYFYGQIIVRVWKQKLSEKQKQQEEESKTNEELKNQLDVSPGEVAKNSERGQPLDATKHDYITEPPFSRETQTRANSLAPKILLDPRQSSKVTPMNPESSHEVRDELSSEGNEILEEEVQDLDTRNVMAMNLQSAYKSAETPRQQQEDHDLVDQEVLERSMNVFDHGKPSFRQSVEADTFNLQQQNE